MKKGVSLRVRVYIEGEDTPANDFAKTGQNFLLQVLAAGMKGYTGPYLLGVKQIMPLEGSDDGDDDSNNSDTEDDASSGFLASWSGTNSTASASGPAGSAHSGGTGPSGPSGEPAQELP